MAISTVFLESERESKAVLGEIAVGIVPAERDGSVGGRREDVIAMPRGRENVLVGLELDHLHLGLVLQRERQSSATSSFWELK